MRRFSHLMVALVLTAATAYGETKPSVAAYANPEPEAEIWKGKPYDTVFGFSFMPGFGFFGAQAGFALNGAVSVKVMHEGFIKDINDQVHLEIMGGPLFLTGVTAARFSLHLKWDFIKNEFWTFYSVGGMGATFLAGSNVGYPRFGIGTVWNPFEFLGFRAELSHEFTGIGIVYSL